LLKISAAMNGAADHPSSISFQIPRKHDMSLLFQAFCLKKRQTLKITLRNIFSNAYRNHIRRHYHFCTYCRSMVLNLFSTAPPL